MRQEENNSERKLIALAKEGDMKAFESLVRKYQKSIYYLCHYMTGAHQSADDLSQEAFIKAYLSLSSFKDGMNFFTWLRKIAVNNNLNYIKSNKREELLGERENMIPDNASSTNRELPQDQLQRNRLEQKFNEALNALPVKQRIIFVLRFHENQSYDEISQLLQLPKGTVMSRLSRARKKLRALLSDYI
jgi:RNA polymerase sigma-70 factor (ECF subfamily)